MGFLNRLKNSFYESIGVSTDYEVAKSNLDHFNKKKRLADNELNICRKIIEDIKKILQIAEEDLTVKNKGGQLSYEISRQSLKISMLKNSNNSSDIDTILNEDDKLKLMIEKFKYIYIDNIITGKEQQTDIKILLSEVISYCNTYHLFNGSIDITNSQRDLNYILNGIQSMISPMEINNINNTHKQQILKNEVETLEIEEKYRKSKRI